MDELLPSEMLAKVASYVSYKDVNSLLRTSKTAHAKLTPYRNVLPKIPCKTYITYRPDKIELSVNFGCNDNVRGYHRSTLITAYLSDDTVSDGDELTEEEKMDQVVRFYKSYGDVREGTFRGCMATLSLHIQSIQAISTIKELALFDCENGLLCEQLTRQMNQSRSRIYRLLIEPKNFHQSHLDLITACSPSFLIVRGYTELPDEFYKLPILQRLDRLEDMTEMKTVYNLPSLSAIEIGIRGRHNITIDDVREMIMQWAESRRKISSLFFPFTRTLTANMCDELLEQIDRKLIEVKFLYRKYHLSKCLLTCRSTSKKLTFKVFSDYLFVRNRDSM